MCLKYILYVVYENNSSLLYCSIYWRAAKWPDDVEARPFAMYGVERIPNVFINQNT